MAAFALRSNTLDFNTDLPDANAGTGNLWRVKKNLAYPRNGPAEVDQNGEQSTEAALSNVDSPSFLAEAIEQLRPVKPAQSSENLRVAFVTKQEWEGVVQEIGRDYAVVKLQDVRRGTAEAELGEIPLEEFSQSDRLRMKKGSIFRWVIGLEKKGQTQTRISQVVLRDLPAWTKREIEDAISEGHQLSIRLKSQVRQNATP